MNATIPACSAPAGKHSPSAFPATEAKAQDGASASDFAGTLQAAGGGTLPAGGRVKPSSKGPAPGSAAHPAAHAPSEPLAPAAAPLPAVSIPPAAAAATPSVADEAVRAGAGAGVAGPQSPPAPIAPEAQVPCAAGNAAAAAPGPPAAAVLIAQFDLGGLADALPAPDTSARTSPAAKVSAPPANGTASLSAKLEARNFARAESASRAPDAQAADPTTAADDAPASADGASAAPLMSPSSALSLSAAAAAAAAPAPAAPAAATAAAANVQAAGAQATRAVGASAPPASASTAGADPAAPPAAPLSARSAPPPQAREPGDQDAAGGEGEKREAGQSAMDAGRAALSGAQQPSSTPAHFAAASHGEASMLASSVPVDGAEFPQDLAQRLSYLIDNKLGGAKLQVNPPQLGPIELQIAVQGDHAQVWMSTHSAVVREALESSLPGLREVLGAQGFTQVSVDIAQQSFQERSAYARPYERAPPAPAAHEAAGASAAQPRRISSAALDAYA